MTWHKITTHMIEAIAVNEDRFTLPQIFNVIDLTSLNNDDTEPHILQFAEKAIMPWGQVAAICVYPRFVPLLSKKFANASLSIATVVNFPDGDATLESVLIEIKNTIANGAQEIDVVFPYQHFLSNEPMYAENFIRECKKTCGEKIKLKVILETGMLKDLQCIAEASHCAIKAGADFIKTSTGKVAVGASLPAAAVMLSVIRELSPTYSAGLKVSGGISEIVQAKQYMALAADVMGEHWLTPPTFRIGASKLVDKIIAHCHSS
jgi:deoxyribose-phosphate aldolase